MVITDLKIRKMMTEGRLRAIVSITLDQMVAVHDIKVVHTGQDTRISNADEN